MFSYTFSTHVAIDKEMILCKGRSLDIVKMKAKPIEKRFKVWAIGDHGYLWTWRWHSKKDGIEGVPNKQQYKCKGLGQSYVMLAPTFGMVIHLAQELAQLDLPFCVYLDNLFLNIPVAQCLLSLGVYCMGTTCKNVSGVPQSLVKMKQHDRALIWDSTIGTIVDNNVMAFLWQDNNAVIAITTAHSLHEPADRVKKC